MTLAIILLSLSLTVSNYIAAMGIKGVVAFKLSLFQKIVLLIPPIALLMSIGWVFKEIPKDVKKYFK